MSDGSNGLWQPIESPHPALLRRFPFCPPWGSRYLTAPKNGKENVQPASRESRILHLVLFGSQIRDSRRFYPTHYTSALYQKSWQKSIAQSPQLCAKKWFFATFLPPFCFFQPGSLLVANPGFAKSKPASRKIQARVPQYSAPKHRPKRPSLSGLKK